MLLRVLNFPAITLLHGLNWDVKQILVLESLQKIYDGSLAVINLSGVLGGILTNLCGQRSGPEVDGVAIVRRMGSGK